MKKLLIITLILFLTQQSTKAESSVCKIDTIDFWHVYYNKTKIKELNGLEIKQIMLKKKNIKPSDILTIKYFNDTPCSDCATFIVIKDKKNNIIIKKNGKGTSKPISIQLEQLVLSKKEEFDVFYSEKKTKNQQKIFPIFKIKLE
jgi:hypothetical protein